MNIKQCRTELILLSVFVLGSYLRGYAQNDQFENQELEKNFNQPSLFVEGFTIQVGLSKKRVEPFMNSIPKHNTRGMNKCILWTG